MIERVETDKMGLLLAMGLGALAAVLLFVQQPLEAFLVFIAAGVFVLAFFHRRAALYIMIPALALSPDIPTLGIPVRVEDFLMVPLLAGWLAHLCVFKDRQRTSLDWLLAAYIVVGVVATLWGTYLGTTHWTTDKGDSAPFHLLKRLEYVLLVFIMADTLRTTQEARHFTYVLLASMLALNLYSLLQFVWIRPDRPIQLGPPGVGSHEAGAASMIAVALALGLIPACKPPTKLLLAAVVVFSLGVLPLSVGRNFVATTLLILLYVGLFRQRWVLLLPALLFLGLFLYPSHVTHRVLSLQHVLRHDAVAEQEDAVGLGYRTAPPVHFATLAVGSSPALGFGLASEVLGDIDSEYGAQIFYTGLVGFAIFLLFGLRLMRLTKLAAATAHDPLDAAVASSLHLVLVGYAIFSIFSTSISTTHTGGYFFVVAGLIAALHRSLAQSPTGIPHDRSEATTPAHMHRP